MRITRFLVALACAALLVALASCASAPETDPNYEAYIQLVKDRDAAAKAEADRAQAQKAADLAALGAMAAACDGDSCVEKVALTAALGIVTGNVAAVAAGGKTEPLPQMYRREPSTSEKVLLSLTGQIGNIATAGFSAYTNVRLSDNNVKTTESLHGFLGGVVSDTMEAADNMQPNVSIQGGYIGGDVTGNGAGIGNTFSVAGDGNAIGDGNTLDNSEGQVNGDFNNNTGRIDSPGPYTDSFNGGDCSDGGAGDGAAGEGDGGDGGGYPNDNCSANGGG